MSNGVVSKYKKWIIGIGIALLLFLGISLIGGSSSKKVESPKSSAPSSAPVQLTQAITTPTPSPEADYGEFFQVKVNRDRGNVINYKLLIKPDDEFLAEDIADSFYKKCSKNCTIDIYDDEKALNLHEAYDLMYMKSETTSQDLKTWENKNYVYVADHYVGRIDFDTKMFNDYPLKDWYYKELGGEN